MIHRPWKWYKKDLPDNSNEPSVFGTFLCGGGSSFGIKLAGFNHLGGIEIDPKMANLYKINHNPKYMFNMDIRNFLKSEKWSDLERIDILEGSPPCTTFSTAGKREKSLGIEKHFTEGSEKQRLDDLFFVWIELLGKIEPKIGVAENVTGILKGQMKPYIKAIERQINKVGYELQIFKINSRNLGVPQARERVFFIARRKKDNLPLLTIPPGNIPAIRFGLVRSKSGKPTKANCSKIARRSKFKEKNIGKARNDGKASGLTVSICRDEEIAQTLTSRRPYRSYDGMSLSTKDVIAVSTFPQDYDFKNTDPQYVCGMSIPPLMTAWIFDAIKEQYF